MPAHGVIGRGIISRCADLNRQDASPGIEISPCAVRKDRKEYNQPFQRAGGNNAQMLLSSIHVVSHHSAIQQWNWLALVQCHRILRL